MSGEDKTVLAMALMRMLSSLVEVSAAILMLRFGKVVTAVRINALLGLFGPTILLLVTLTGVAGLAGKIAPARLAMIIAGVALIIAATRA